MMQMINRFIKHSENAVEMNISVETISALPVMRKLMRMGEEIGEDDLEKYNDLRMELDTAFTDLTRTSKQEAESHES
jgi:V/A-type H+-transporting ATPase subunit A